MLYEMCVRTRKLDSERLQDVAAMMTSSTAHGSQPLRTLRVLNSRLGAMTKKLAVRLVILAACYIFFFSCIIYMFMLMTDIVRS
jgi:hypothetical protein